MKKIILLLPIVILLILLVLFLKFQKTPKSYVLATPLFQEDITPALAKSLEKVHLNLESAPMINGETITASVSGYRAVFSKNADFDSQVRALQFVLGGLKMDDKTITEIDLRFNKVIIRH